MSIEEIIKELEDYASWLAIIGDHEVRKEIEAVDAAIALLRTHPEAQSNEPLTPEEFRNMGGQPVWTHSDIFPGDCGCRVVKKAGVLDVEFTDRRCFRLTDYGKSWLAYRRPPKEKA